MEIEAVGTPVAPRRGMSLEPEAVTAGEFGLLLLQMCDLTALGTPAATADAGPAVPAASPASDSSSSDESLSTSERPERARGDGRAPGVSIEPVALAAGLVAPTPLPATVVGEKATELAAPPVGRAREPAADATPVGRGSESASAPRSSTDVESPARRTARGVAPAEDQTAGADGIEAAPSGPASSPRPTPAAAAGQESAASTPAAGRRPAFAAKIGAERPAPAPESEARPAAAPEVELQEAARIGRALGRPDEVPARRKSPPAGPAPVPEVEVQGEGEIEPPAERPVTGKPSDSRPGQAPAVAAEAAAQGANGIEPPIEGPARGKPSEARPGQAPEVAIEVLAKGASGIEPPVEVPARGKPSEARPAPTPEVELEVAAQGAREIERPAKGSSRGKPSDSRPGQAPKVAVETAAQDASGIEPPAEGSTREKSPQARPAPAPLPPTTASGVEEAERRDEGSEPAAGVVSPAGRRSPEVDVLQARGGAERLWGYWLRRANLTTGHADAPAPRGGDPAPFASAGPGRRAEPAADAGLSAVGQPEVSTTPLPVPPSAPLSAEAPAAAPSAALASAAQAPAPAAGRAEAAPAPAAPRSPVPPKAPAQQVLPLARLSLSRRGERVTVQLDPESLGKVQLVVSREGQGVVAHFRVETAEAHQALVAEAPLLRRELEAQGVSLVRVSVDLEDGSGGWREPRTAKRNGRRGAANYALGEIPAEVPAAGAPMSHWGFDARV